MKKIILTLILSFAIISCETPSQANSDFPELRQHMVVVPPGVVANQFWPGLLDFYFCG